MQVYLNGEFVDHADAKVSVDDRGFLFADGVYEVIRVYDGRPFLMEPHVVRMKEGLRALQIDPSSIDDLEQIAERLLRENGLTDGDATIYAQVSRGVAPRKHAFPPDATPTVYMAAKRFNNHPSSYFEQGVPAITIPDNRWARCDIKSIALLPNVLANQAAHAADAFEALYVKDGVVIEGSHSNMFAVLDGTLITYPKNNYILAGITRALVIEMAHELNIPVAEAPLYWERLNDVEEMFLSGTTTEVMPITKVDGRPVGDGRVGPITKRLQEAYAQRAHQQVGASA
ncbi:MAG: D-amino-acid transaminase [Longimicrobiales bacterium]